jgi:hypothetical protein
MQMPDRSSNPERARDQNLLGLMAEGEPTIKTTRDPAPRAPRPKGGPQDDKPGRRSSWRSSGERDRAREAAAARWDG